VAENPNGNKDATERLNSERNDCIGFPVRKHYEPLPCPVETPMDPGGFRSNTARNRLRRTSRLRVGVPVPRITVRTLNATSDRVPKMFVDSSAGNRRNERSAEGIVVVVFVIFVRAREPVEFQ